MSSIALNRKAAVFTSPKTAFLYYDRIDELPIQTCEEILSTVKKAFSDIKVGTLEDTRVSDDGYQWHNRIEMA